MKFSLRFVSLLGLVLGMAVGAGLPQASAQSSPVPIDRIVARVDNHIVLLSELEVGILQAKNAETLPAGDLKCRVLESLIINKLLLAKADLDSVTVEPKSVDSELDQRMNYMIAQMGGKENIEKTYGKSTEQLKSELRRSVQEQLLVQKMQREITKDAKVTPAEIRKFFASIPKDSLPFFSKEVEVGQIVVKARVGRDERAKARVKAVEILQKIKKGDLGFQDMAKLYSQDPGSAENGGDLGFASRGQMVPEFEAAALRLKENEISDPVESQFGWHVIQLVEKRGTDYRARHILIRPENSQEDLQKAIERADSIRTAILNDSLTFEAAVKKYTEDPVTKMTSGYFADPATGTTRIALENLDPTVYFTIDTMKVGQISGPQTLKTDDGKPAARIIFYKSYLPPHEANLKDDYQKIQAAALNQKKTKALATYFGKMRSDIFVNIDKEYASCELFEDMTQP